MSCAMRKRPTISVHQGETAQFGVTFREPNNTTPLDITGDKLRIVIASVDGSLLLRLTSGAPVDDAVGSNPFDPALPPTSSSIEIVDGVAGKAFVSISAVVMAAMPAGNHEYEIDRIRPDGSVNTFVSGEFIVIRQLG